MNDWKQAFSIAKLELKASILHFLFALAFILFLIFTLVKSVDSYIDNGFAGFDFIFILIFTFAPVWMKPKVFQIQTIGNMLASPVLVMQNQLPISKDVLVKSRFIIHFFYTFPFQLLTLMALYTLTPLQDLFSAGAFIAFAVIWIAFGIYAGYVIPYSEAGGKAPGNSDFLTGLSALIILVAILLLLTFFHLLFGNGIVYWSILLAQKWSLPTAVFSIILAIAGYYHWKFYMKKSLSKTDYL
ncbi:hypothetical protein [Virgibacillus kimchii]